MADPEASSPPEPPGASSDSISDRVMRNVRNAVQFIFVANEPANFSTVRRAELEEINKSRALRGRDPVDNDLVGFACSGGGIRSATFNLGIIQALAKYGWLRQIDYTSTISGGGYIGSWLVAWIRRVGSAAVEQRLSDNRQPAPANEPDRYLEPDQVRFLRKYSNYLAPLTGLLGADTWTMVAVYLRNLILNLVVLIACGTCLLLVPDLGLWLFQSQLVLPASVLEAFTAIALVLLMAVTGMGFGALSSESPARRDWRRAIVAKAGILTSGTTLLAAVCSMLLLGYWHVGVGTVPINQWILWSGGLYLALWLVAVACWGWCRAGKDVVPIEGTKWFRWTMLGLTALLIGALFGWMIYEIGRLFEWLNPQGANPAWLYAGRVALITLGPPLLMVTTMIAAVFQMGLSGRTMPDAQREWLARAGAVTFLLALFWMVGTGASLYGPLLVKFLVGSQWATEQWGRFFKWVVGLGWLSTTAAGLMAGRSASTNGAGNGKFSLITRIAPPVFAAGLVLLLSFGLDAGLGYIAAQPAGNVSATGHEQRTAAGKISSPIASSVDQLLNASSLKSQAQAVAQLDKSQVPEGASLHELAVRHWTRIGTYARSDPHASLWDKVTGSCLWQLLLVCLAVLLIFSNRVDINEFSLHLFYRNRLTRAYLGASVTGREPDPFTGFSAEDDVLLHDLTVDSKKAQMAIDAPQTAVDPAAHYDGPYPIFGTALNLVRGKELAWQNRKAASFVFTPQYCGYDYYDPSPKTKRRYRRSAYRPTQEYTRRGGPRLGTAVAISGAAASPNMGYHTSSALGFLMTVFNVRLGGWFANPRHATLWRRRSAPAWGLLYLLRELFPRTSDDMQFVYLSDGGHFENLGLYELVRRRCRYIICGDGSCDVKRSFDDLGRAVDKCRRDFGVEIDIKLEKLLLDEKQRSAAHFAMGAISYPDSEQKGFLLYIKPALVGDEPSDVFSYCKQNPKFPHDTTADQFFSESQFESYRALGYYSFDALARLASAVPSTDKRVEKRFSVQTLLVRLAQLRDAPPSVSLWKDIGQVIGRHLKPAASVERATGR